MLESSMTNLVNVAIRPFICKPITDDLIKTIEMSVYGLLSSYQSAVMMNIITLPEVKVTDFNKDEGIVIVKIVCRLSSLTVVDGGFRCDFKTGEVDICKIL